MKTIKEILIERDGMSEAAADELIAEAREALQVAIEEGDFFEAENVCEDYFGLEPDYLMELM